MDKNPRDQLANRLKEANNVLVTVSTNPSVDQLSAAIGFTLFLSKLKKHSTAVFSGQVPSTIEFLKPEETIEGNTDSLQDFIIALDKNKADKIRYKVEDQMVKIFITPYRSSIDEQDLQFSKGDFNVDVVVAIGVHNKEELDQAITAHGRILHDATVATLNLKESSELGAINWTDGQASSLCEMVVVLADLVKPNSFDAQMSTALLTGIVAETQRFSNEKTTSNTMNASAKLMAAGANQQLVATKLEEPGPPPPEAPQQQEGEKGGSVSEEPDEGDGTLQITHEEKILKPPSPPPTAPEPEKPIDQIEISQEGELARKTPPTPPSPPPPAPLPPPPPPAPPEPKFPEAPPPPHIEPEHRKFLEAPPTTQRHDDTVMGGPAGQNIQTPAGSHMVTEPPTMGAKLSAMSEDFHAAEESDETPLTLPPVQPTILTHGSNPAGGQGSPAASAPKPPNLAQAAKPPAPPKPPTPAPLPPPPPSIPPAPPPPKPAPIPPPLVPKSKLPTSFINTLDDDTLKELEQRTGSPHRIQAATNLDDKTLQSIEQTVHSSHKAPPTPPLKPILPAKDTSLQYEPHESEPPEKKPSLPLASDSDAAAARAAVTEALNAGVERPTPLKGLGTHNVDLAIDHAAASPSPPPPTPLTASKPLPVAQEPSTEIEKIDDEGQVTFVQKPPNLPMDHTATKVDDPTAPPPVPPPMMPPPPPTDNKA